MFSMSFSMSTLVLLGIAVVAIYSVWRPFSRRRDRARLEANFRSKILDPNPDWRFIGIAMTHDILTIEEATNIVLQLTAKDVDYTTQVEPSLIEALKEIGQLPADYAIPEEELEAREARRLASQPF
jgi:hypothetical protein